MKKFTFSVLVLAVAVLALQIVANAATVQGSVSAVDAQAGTLTISTIDPETGAASDQLISVGAATAFAGVASLAEVAVGDSVTAEVSATAEGSSADSVTVVK